MDRITEQTMAAVIAAHEAAALVPPEDLTGAARSMFEAIVANNRSRPWGQAHAYLLADYCRVAVMWEEQRALIVAEGPMVGGKVNKRLNCAALLSADRMRIGRLLGLGTNTMKDRMSNQRREDAAAREAGSARARSAANEDGDLLA